MTIIKSDEHWKITREGFFGIFWIMKENARSIDMPHLTCNFYKYLHLTEI